MNVRKNDTLIIVLVFNEEKNIENVLNDLNLNCKETDILLVDDGSTDKSIEKVESKDIFVIKHPFNMGIGTSFETGCRFALEQEYNYIVRMDGDGQHNSAFIQDVLAPVKNNEADIVVGSRFLGNSEFKSSFFRLIGIFIISFILAIITRKKVTDPTSGFCAMNKKAFKFFSKNCPEDYPEPEILMYHREFRFKEVPITINKRCDGISSITPLKSLYYMIKVLFSLFIHIFKKEERE